MFRTLSLAAYATADAIVECSAAGEAATTGCTKGAAGCPKWCIAKAGPVGKFAGAPNGQYNCDIADSFGAHWCLNGQAGGQEFNSPAKGCSWLKAGVTEKQKQRGVSSLAFAHSRNQGKATCGQCFIAAVNRGTHSEVQLVMGVDQNVTWPDTSIYDWSDHNFMGHWPTGNDSAYGKLADVACDKVSGNFGGNCNPTHPSQKTDVGVAVSIYVSNVVDCNDPDFELPSDWPAVKQNLII